jgi:hypothetical protein
MIWTGEVKNGCGLLLDLLVVVELRAVVCRAG